jgi:endonuclease G
MKRKFILFTMLCVMVLLFTSVVSRSDDSVEFNFEPTSEGEIIKREYYSFSYSEAHEQPMWVSYEINHESIIGEATRKGSFRSDPLVSTKTASAKDYKNSGYDRGHLAPAFDLKATDMSMYDSFYMSNISPQKPGFNRGIWKRLENQTRDWAVENVGLFVTTGPVLTGFIDTIGVVNRVPVPKYFYKVLLDYHDPEYKMIAFVIPNENSLQPLSDFVISVDSLEMLTNIDFYSDLPDEIENVLEKGKSVKTSNWKFR